MGKSHRFYQGDTFKKHRRANITIMFTLLRDAVSVVADYTIGTVIVMVQFAAAERHSRPRALMDAGSRP